jgi:hypothetical protein
MRLLELKQVHQREVSFHSGWPSHNTTTIMQTEKHFLLMKLWEGKAYTALNDHFRWELDRNALARERVNSTHFLVVHLNTAVVCCVLPANAQYVAALLSGSPRLRLQVRHRLLKAMGLTNLVPQLVLSTALTACAESAAAAEYAAALVSESSVAVAG